MNYGKFYTLANLALWTNLCDLQICIMSIGFPKCHAMTEMQWQKIIDSKTFITLQLIVKLYVFLR